MGDDVYAFLDEITSLAFYSTQTRSVVEHSRAEQVHIRAVY